MDIAAVGATDINVPLPFNTFIMETLALTTDDIAIVSIGPIVYIIGVSSDCACPGGLSIFTSSSIILVTNLGDLE